MTNNYSKVKITVSYCLITALTLTKQHKKDRINLCYHFSTAEEKITAEKKMSHMY